MKKAITFITPTYARDYERFLLQRESIEACGIEVPHVAIVDTEDLARFREIPFRRNLTILTSEQVLGRSMDRRRQVWGISRKDYRYWITGKGVHGWFAQQLMKLAAAGFVGTEGMVCLDSDTVFVERVTSEDFYAADGKLHLYETTDDLDVEMAEWYAHSLRFLGVKEVGVGLRRFTHSPVPLHREVVREMQKWIEGRYKMNWMEAMFRGERITEYTTYGTFARHVDGLKRVSPVRPGLALYFWWAVKAEELLGRLEREVELYRPKMVLINSNMGIPVEVYRSALRSLFQGGDARDASGEALVISAGAEQIK